MGPKLELVQIVPEACPESYRRVQSLRFVKNAIVFVNVIRLLKTVTGETASESRGRALLVTSA